MKAAAITLLAVITAGGPVWAASQQNFTATYAAAESAQQRAMVLQNAWTATAAALKAAKTAAAAQDYDRALDLAKKAEAMAKVSIEEAKEQKTLWRQAVVH